MFVMASPPTTFAALLISQHATLPEIMIRTIDEFRQDATGDWIAELSCAHGQHVRHRPPWSQRFWVQSEAGRASRVGQPLDCPLCDRAELPIGLKVVRSVGPFDEVSLPKGLRKDHRVADRTWAQVRVIGGSIGFSMRTAPPMTIRLEAGGSQAIPPGVPHALEVLGPVQVVIDFLVPA